MTMLADLNGAGAPRLTFDVAYSVYAAYEDGLRVDVLLLLMVRVFT